MGGVRSGVRGHGGLRIAVGLCTSLGVDSGNVGVDGGVCAKIR